MASLRLLITGATGYIGGSVLSTILKSNENVIRKLEVSALVRGEDKAASLSSLGVRPILFKDLDDLDVIRTAASEHDVVIHTASGFHTASAKALILGLAERKRQTGKDVYYIHTSGTSNLGDRPITGQYTESRIFSDKENIYAYMKHRESVEAYPQRTTDLAVVDTGRDAGVKTYIIMSPTIYGLGSGSFNVQSIQIPIMIRAAIKSRQAIVIGDGGAVWNHVHIDDLTKLYELILAKVAAGEDIPSGEKGIYFSETGENTWLELSEGVAKAGYMLGVLDSTDVRSVSLEEGAENWAGGNAQIAELGFASNSRTKAELGRELGWKPRKTKADLEQSFVDEFKAILESQKAQRI